MQKQTSTQFCRCRQDRNAILTDIRIVLKFVEHHSWAELFKRIRIAAFKRFFENRNVLIMKLRPEETGAPNPDLEIKELLSSDVAQMLSVMYLRQTDIHKRFDHGDRCFAVIDDGKISSYMWVQYGVKHLDELYWVLNLNPHQAWFYNAVTLKHARGRGYYPNLYFHMAKVLRLAGFNELLIDVNERNRPSIRGLEKVGFKQVAKVQMKKRLSKFRYKITVFDKQAWRELSGIINDFPGTRSVIEEAVNES